MAWSGPDGEEVTRRPGAVETRTLQRVSCDGAGRRPGGAWTRLLALQKPLRKVLADPLGQASLCASEVAGSAATCEFINDVGRVEERRAVLEGPHWDP